MDDLEFYIRKIKNGYIVWESKDYESIFCENQAKVIEIVNDKIKKYIR